MIRCYSFMILSSLLFRYEYFIFILGPNVLQISLIDFFLLLLTELFKKLPLAFHLMNDIPILLDLLLVLFDVLLYSESDIWSRGAMRVLHWLMVGFVVNEVIVVDSVILVIVLGLYTVSVHLLNWFNGL